MKIIFIAWHSKILFYNSEGLKKSITSCHQTLQFKSYPQFCGKRRHCIWRHSALKWPLTPVFHSWFLKFKPISINWQKIVKSYPWELITAIVLKIYVIWKIFLIARWLCWQLWTMVWLIPICDACKTGVW